MIDVTVLQQALPYIQRYKGKTFLVKVGGGIAKEPELLGNLARNLSLLHNVGIRILVVHGGGPQATELSEKLGHPVNMVEGRRVTDEATLEVAKMVFAGKINVEILCALRKQGSKAVGVSGVDGNIIRAVRRPVKEVVDPVTGEKRQVDYGLVGEIVEVDTGLLTVLMDQGYVPVISSLGADDEGNIFNINADTVASALARDLKVQKFINLTDVPGILADPKDPTSVISHCTTAKARELLASGAILKGMRPKLTSSIEAVEGGVARAHIISGVEKNALLEEIFTRKGSGTMITHPSGEEAYLREMQEAHADPNRIADYR